MDEFYEISSESSNEDDEEEENDSHASFVIHNNNGSFIDRKVLSTQEVYDMMQKETNKVCDIADVSESDEAPPTRVANRLKSSRFPRAKRELYSTTSSGTARSSSRLSTKAARRHKRCSRTSGNSLLATLEMPKIAEFATIASRILNTFKSSHAIIAFAICVCRVIFHQQSKTAD